MEQPTPASADRQEHDRHHRRSFAVLLVAFCFLVGTVASAGVYYSHCNGAGDERVPVSITVAEGSSGTEVVDQLADRNVIRCGGLVGRLMLQKNGQAGAIRAGTFRLTTGMTLGQAMAVLTSPQPAVPTISLTIPEGFRITQIASLTRKLGIPPSRFVSKATAGGYSLPGLLPAGKSTEGFLFPETYEFLRHGTSADEVIRKLVDQFAAEAKTLPFDHAKALGISRYQAVVVASLIEKEARVDADRPLVAAVIYNRLAQNMILGFDSTVAYIDPNPSDGLTSSDFKIDSPYNTRLNAGLPPTPIASPGRASLLAALSPAKTGYLFFLDCPGQDRLVFESTYDQFISDKRACLG